MPKRVWLAGALCSVVPDLDVIGFRFGIRYGDFWGHRGFTHSLLFTAVLAAFVAILGFRRTSAGTSNLWIWIYLFLATASHGFLDAMTDGGLGVAFFFPFNNDRYFLPWRPILVSPIGVSRFFSARDWKFYRASSSGSGSPQQCWRPWVVLPPTANGSYRAAARRRMSSCLRVRRSRRPGPAGLASM